jgi:hypothetical protein
MYAMGALYNAWQVQQGQYPGWAAEFGIDDSVPAAVVSGLRDLGASVQDYTGLGFAGSARMLWRWMPLVDHKCGVMISRDTDSCIFPCDHSTVEFWLEHVRTMSMTIRASESHGSVESGPGYMGGLCGFRWAPVWRHLGCSLTEYAMQHKDPAGCGVDQAWLSYVVYPLMRDSYAEFGHGKDGDLPHKIQGEPGPVHMGAPWGPSGELIGKMGWEKVCASCV